MHKMHKIFCNTTQDTRNQRVAKLSVIFHLMHFADIVRCVAFCIIIIVIVIYGFLVTQRQITLKDWIE